MVEGVLYIIQDENEFKILNNNNGLVYIEGIRGPNPPPYL